MGSESRSEHPRPTTSGQTRRGDRSGACAKCRSRGPAATRPGTHHHMRLWVAPLPVRHAVQAQALHAVEARLLSCAVQFRFIGSPKSMTSIVGEDCAQRKDRPFVTGSTSGIGLGVACRPRGAGANVVLNGFGDTGARRPRWTAPARHGIRVGYHGADMSKPAEITHDGPMPRRVRRRGHLVNNAGIQHVASSRTSPSSAGTRSSPSTSARPSTRCAWRFPAMRKKNWGASSTSPRRTAWWPRQSRPTWRPSTASSG